MTPEFRRLVRTHLFYFVVKAFTETHGRTPDGRDYIEHLCYFLQQLAQGEIKRLLINLPPRHLKTFIASICLAAWILGKRPATKIMIVSYGERLAESIAYQLREVLRSPWYREIFPKTKLSTDRSQVGHFFTPDGGAVYSASIDGPLGGFGANIILVDDPVDLKYAGDIERNANSARRFFGVVRTRLDNQKEGGICITQHRLNEEDLSGRVLREGGERWKRVVLPFFESRTRTYRRPDGGVYLRKKGTLLRQNGFSHKDVKELINSLVNPDFETLYQQNPAGLGSFRIKAEYLKRMDITGLPQVPLVVSVDPSGAGGPLNSYGVIQVWAPIGGQYLLRHQWRERARIDEMGKQLRKVVKRDRPSAILIEKAGNGEALLELARRKNWRNVIPVTPGDSKITRLLANKKPIRSGWIILPDYAEWVEEFIEELTRFPRAGSDDQVDAMTQFLDYMATKPVLHLPPPRALGAVALASQTIFDQTAPSREVGSQKGLAVLVTTRRF
jgi:predicted phage terminase large subunit-like protein